MGISTPLPNFFLCQQVRKVLFNLEKTYLILKVIFDPEKYTKLGLKSIRSESTESQKVSLLYKDKVLKKTILQRRSMCSFPDEDMVHSCPVRVQHVSSQQCVTWLKPQHHSVLGG
jgi:hypothetical protein